MLTSIKSSIYKIRNKINGKLYIGSAVKISLRWARHRCDLNLNRHQNRLLQRAWNKYGVDAFIFEIIEVVEPAKLIEREQFWLDWLKPIYNLTPTAGNSLGVKHTEETRKRMSLAKQQMTEKTKKKISEINKGRKHTDEHKAKISKGNIGRIVSQETKDKIGAAHKGRKNTTEQIEAKKIRQRKLDKWPHANGRKCKCKECKEKLRTYQRNWERSKSKTIKFTIIIGAMS